MKKYEEMNQYELKSEYEKRLKYSDILHDALVASLCFSYFEEYDLLTKIMIYNCHEMQAIKKVAEEKNCLSFVLGC